MSVPGNPRPRLPSQPGQDQRADRRPGQAVQHRLGLLGTNGPDQTLGNFDTARVQRMIEIVTPIFIAQRQLPKEGLTPEDIATNKFIDTSIGIDA